MKKTINREIKLLKYSVSAFIGMLALFVHHFYLDANLYNRIITYPDHIDKDNLELASQEYCPGEMVQYKVAFDKNRESTGSIKWTMLNDRFRTFDATVPREVPVGHYSNQNGEPLILDIVEVPEDTEPGVHKFVAVVDHELPDGRKRKLEIGTETFTVPEKCDIM